MFLQECFKQNLLIPTNHVFTGMFQAESFNSYQSYVLVQPLLVVSKI